LQPFVVIRGCYRIREFTAHEQLLAYLKRAKRSTIRVIKRTAPGDVDVSTEYPGVNVQISEGNYREHPTEGESRGKSVTPP